MLEGFRREVTVNDLCRREGIKPHSYYSWTKEFMEAGRERLSRDTVRDATRQEIQDLKRENGELKQLVAELSFEVYRLKKTAIPMPQKRRRYQRMSAVEKATVLASVAASPLAKRRVLRDLGVPKSTYYRWLRHQDQQGLEDRLGGDQPPWNRLRPQEERSILEAGQGDAGAK